jgi:DNA-binding response OmpR family regulator
MNENRCPHILIVDDTPHNLQVAGEILGRQGYKITLAQSGVDALSFVNKNNPDLILLDIMMPEMDGFKVCQYLKENVETRFIPVIFLTARAQIEDIVKGFELGGADYLTKPFNEKELIARVKSQLELVKLQVMLRQKNRKLLEEMRLRKQREHDLIAYEKGRYVNVLVSGIAHEFNNLLQVILGYGELVAETLAEDSEEKKLQDDLLQAGQKTARIVEQLIYFADKKSVRKLEKIELSSFIKDRISLFRGIFPENISFNFKISDELLVIEADKAELAQILMNIFLNASQAIGREGKIDVRISGINDEKKKQRHALIEIEDNGSGMDPAITAKDFSPFSNSSQDKGIGLGLGVVRSVLKRLGGYADLHSQPSIGTVCRLFIPVIENLAKQDDYQSGSNFLEPQMADGELILLVEDEDSVLFLQKKILEKLGYRVITARNGEVGVQLFKKYQDEVKLVLLDIGLPGKTGIEAGKEIKSLTDSVAIVYCTAYTDRAFDEIADKGMVLQKPFDKNEITTIVRQALQ